MALGQAQHCLTPTPTSGSGSSQRLQGFIIAQLALSLKHLWNQELCCCRWTVQSFPDNHSSFAEWGRPIGNDLSATYITYLFEALCRSYLSVSGTRGGRVSLRESRRCGCWYSEPSVLTLSWSESTVLSMGSGGSFGTDVSCNTNHRHALIVAWLCLSLQGYAFSTQGSEQRLMSQKRYWRKVAMVLVI